MQFTIKDKTFDSGRLNAFRSSMWCGVRPGDRVLGLAGAGDPEAFSAEGLYRGRA